MKKILLPHGKLKIVARLSECTEAYARFCLRGAVETELSKRVRKIALSKEIGGVEIK